MVKICIFSTTKQCDNCGECERCDLNSKKQCNNCGKCLEMNGVDIKAIKINELLKAEENEVGDVSNSEIDKDMLLEDIPSESYDEEQEGFEDEVDSETEEDYTLEEVELVDFDYDKEYKAELSEIEESENEEWELIDDIDGLSDVLSDEQALQNLTKEQFPGLLRFVGR